MSEALIGAVGWLGAETLHTPLANALGWESLLEEASNSAAKVLVYEAFSYLCMRSKRPLTPPPRY